MARPRSPSSKTNRSPAGRLLDDALASVGLAPTDDTIPVSDLASEQSRSRKLSADAVALYQRLAATFPVYFDLQHPVPLMPNIDAAIRQHGDFRLVSLTSLGNVLAFVTDRRQYWLCLTRKGARLHALDGTPLDPIELDVRQVASAKLARIKAKPQAGKV